MLKLRCTVTIHASPKGLLAPHIQYDHTCERNPKMVRFLFTAETTASVSCCSDGEIAKFRRCEVPSEFDRFWAETSGAPSLDRKLSVAGSRFNRFISDEGSLIEGSKAGAALEMTKLVNSKDTTDKIETTKHTLRNSPKSPPCQYTWPKYEEAEPRTANIALYLEGHQRPRPN